MRRPLQQKRRVVFIVPTVPLVEQQQKLISLYVQHDETVLGFYGGDGRNACSRLSDLLSAHVVVTTPQLLVNLMSSVHRSERVNVCDFTLMIFDECHHCGKNHPYELLMRQVRAYAAEAEADATRSKPQIIGLTASLGTGTEFLEPQSTEKVRARGANARAERVFSICFASAFA